MIWYVAHAKPGAQIALGLKPGVSKAQFEEAIRQERAGELLNWINVFPGEMIYVAGGTVHTLGPGSVLVETQQQSDTTYRLYDYGRPRELHLAQGLLGFDAPIAKLGAAFAVAARQPICKGFAVGRSIFGKPAEDWLAGRIDDAAAVRRMASAYRRLIDIWRAARSAAAEASGSGLRKRIG